MTKDEFIALREKYSLKKDELWAKLNEIDYQFKEAITKMYEEKYSKFIGKLLRIDFENQINYIVFQKVSFDGVEPCLTGYLTRIQLAKDKCISISYNSNSTLNLSKWNDFDNIKTITLTEYNDSVKEYNNHLSNYLKENNVFKQI